MTEFLPDELFCDTETFCEKKLSEGTHAYAEKAEIMVVTWALGDGPVNTWDRTANPIMPAELRRELNNPQRLTVWQNGAGFDRPVLKHCLRINLPIERVHDTMVQALTHGLPGSLDSLCGVFKIAKDEAKDKAGKQLIQLFCKPRPKNHKLRRATRITHPVEWQQFLNYAAQDIVSMRAIYRKLPKWNYKGKELELWYLDQKINNRGVKVDIDLAHAAIRAIGVAQTKLAKKTQNLTQDQVQSATQRDLLLKFILEYWGIWLPDMKAANIERRIADPELPWALKELLGVRLDSSTTSTSKYKKLISAVSKDGRLRGLLQFCGAARTGRWAGRVFQPQNLPRPPKHHDQETIEYAIRAMKKDALHMVVDDEMKIISSALRGCIISDSQKKLVVSDLSNIEGRAAAWLAGEEWKLKAFQDYDTFLYDRDLNKIPDGKGDFKRKGHDLYILAYAASFNVKPSTVDSYQRQLGKVQELALGYQGGVGAFVTFAMTYKMDLNDLSEQAFPVIPDEYKRIGKAAFDNAWKRRGGSMGLTEKVYIVCDALKQMWREAHPQISTYWDEIQNAAKKAINNPGITFQCRKLKFRRDGEWLRMGLPSGRVLCYSQPHVDNRGQITYMGVNQYTRKWGRIKTYGGKLFENACQAFARDVMAENMPRIEAKGYEIILTVHDEIITEAPDNDDFNTEELSNLLSFPPAWADDIPLAASGFEGYRYKKD